MTTKWDNEEEPQPKYCCKEFDNLIEWGAVKIKENRFILVHFYRDSYIYTIDIEYCPIHGKKLIIEDE